MNATYFSPATFRFLDELAGNNNREWFNANKERYEREVREPALDFITDFTGRLQEISPHFVADPRKQGGSMFRINRDVRFSNDKSPYKTAVGIQFRHEAAKSAYTPGFYLHIAPGECFAGGGIWHPPSPELRAVRTYLAENPDEWHHAVHQPPFVSTVELTGDSLQRAPKGFDPDCDVIEDLKRKDFIATGALTQKQVTSEDFLDQYAVLCGAVAPLIRFVCRALDLAY